MEVQSKQDNYNRNTVANEIEKFKEEFVHILNDKTKIIENQASQLVKLSSEVVYLQNKTQHSLYACEICDFETQDKDILLDHKNNMHERIFEN